MEKTNVYIDPTISCFKLSELYKTRSINKFEDPDGEAPDCESKEDKENDKYLELTGKDIIFTDGEFVNASVLNEEDGKIDYAVRLDNFNYVIIASVKQKFLHFSNGGGLFYVIDNIAIYKNKKDRETKKSIKNIINQIYENAKVIDKTSICYFDFNKLMNLNDTNCISDYNNLNNGYSRKMTK